MPLRVGTVPYLVARPINLGLEAEPGFEVAREVPARLVERLRAGTIDVALVSSIELFRSPGYGYIVGPAIAGRGYVASVQVFLRREIGALRSVVLDPASRTSQALAQIVLARREPGLRFRESPAGRDPRAEAEGNDDGGWLRIGDRSLVEALSPGAPPTLNPSELWAKDTGLPFVFALWIVRPGVELTPDQLAGFARARERGRAALDTLAREAARDWALPVERCLEYLAKECLFDPGEQLEPALLRFRDEAARLSLCRAELTPRAIRAGAPECRS